MVNITWRYFSILWIVLHRTPFSFDSPHAYSYLIRQRKFCMCWERKKRGIQSENIHWNIRYFWLLLLYCEYFKQQQQSDHKHTSILVNIKVKCGVQPNMLYTTFNGMSTQYVVERSRMHAAIVCSRNLSSGKVWMDDRLSALAYNMQYTSVLLRYMRDTYSLRPFEIISWYGFSSHVRSSGCCRTSSNTEIEAEWRNESVQTAGSNFKYVCTTKKIAEWMREERGEYYYRILGRDEEQKDGHHQTTYTRIPECAEKMPSKIHNFTLDRVHQTYNINSRIQKKLSHSIVQLAGETLLPIVFYEYAAISDCENSYRRYFLSDIFALYYSRPNSR